MPPSDISSYFWLLIPVGTYLIFALALYVFSRKAAWLTRLNAALHIVAIGILLNLSLGDLPGDWPSVVSPYAKAMIAFGCLVLFIQVLEGVTVGYFLVRLRGRPIPPILRRFILMASYFIVATIILRAYLGLDVTSLVATSAVVSFVVGLASQDLLGSVLAGIVVGIERPLRLGDWVTIEGQEGNITDITWRRTELRTRDGDLVVLPNSRLMKSSIVNHSRPSSAHRVTLEIGAHYRHAPNQVKNAILEAAGLCRGVKQSPEPSVFLLRYDDSAITYRLNAWIEDFALLERIRDQINTYAWYQFKREGVEIPFPIRTLHQPREEAPGEEVRRDMVERILPFLKDAELFAAIPNDKLEQLAATMRLETYGAGEALFREGKAGRDLYMLLSGEAKVLKKKADGGNLELATLHPGDICGEMSLLLEQPRMATVRLSRDSRIISMGPSVFRALADAHPEFLEHLGRMVEERGQANEALQAIFSRSDDQSPEGRIQAALGRIRLALKL